MERDLSSISQINDWAYLIALETGLFTRGELSGKTLQALNAQARVLSQRYLVHKARLDIRVLTAAEREILDVLSDATVNLRRRKRLPHNIVKSLKAGGLIAAVERSVCAAGILQCRYGFMEDGIEPGAFEEIVARYPQEFGVHAQQNAATFLAQEAAQLAVAEITEQLDERPVLQASA